MEYVIRNRFALIGFALLAAGPFALFILSQIQIRMGYLNFPDFLASVTIWTIILLPGIGALFSIISLVRWKKTGVSGRILSIVTVLICNPYFYFFYYVFCAYSVVVLTGLPEMVSV